MITCRHYIYHGALKHLFKRIDHPWKSIIQCRSRSHGSTVDPEVLDMKRNVPGTDGENAKPADQIPGPLSLPLIGTLYTHLPGARFDYRRNFEAGRAMYEEYGPVVREEVVPGTIIYHVFEPEDIQTVFRSEGRFPHRAPLMGLAACREDRNQSVGLVNLQEKEWRNLRSCIQHELLRPSTVTSYLPVHAPIADDLLTRLEKVRDTTTQEIPDFVNEISKWALESICVVVLDGRPGALSSDNTEGPGTRQFIRTVGEFLHGTYWTSMMWGVHSNKKTRTYRRLERANDALYEISQKYLIDAMRRMLTKDVLGDQVKHEKDENTEQVYQRGFLRSLLMNPDLSVEDILVTASDFMMAGVDTTTSLVIHTLYHLARNPKEQEVLRQEILKVAPPGYTPTADIINNIAYLKGAVTEAMRLTPVAPASARTLAADAVLSGYRIPAGSQVVYHTPVCSTQEKYFSDPLSYKPGRWLRENRGDINPFIVLPFGRGPRMCIGKRLALQEAYLLIIRMLQTFRMVHEGEEQEFITRLITMPSGPVRIKFQNLQK